MTISGDSSVSVLSHKVSLTKILPGSKGFTVSSVERQLEVDWNIFDPGEGIQIVLLSTGNSKSLDVTGRFLPGQAIVRFPVRSLLKGSALGIAWVGGGFLTILLMAIIVPFIKERTSSRFIAGALTSVALITVLLTCVIAGFYLSYSARSYVGDISPIDPYLTYIDINREIDYRYVPM